MLTEEEIIWTFRILLGREPSPEDIRVKLSSKKNLGELVENVCTGTEFLRKHEALIEGFADSRR